MKRAIFSTLLLLSCPLLGGLNEQNDFQTWTEYSLKMTMGKSALYFETEQRFGDNSSELFLYYFQGQYIYSPTPCIDIAPGYRHLYVRFFKGEPWSTIYNPLLDVSFKTCMGNLQIINRNRFQYFILEHIPNTWRYRNRTTFILSRRWGKTRYHPLFSQEFFFQKREGYVENRMEIGGISFWGKGSNYQVLYLFEMFKNEGHWTQIHALRLKLNFVF